MRKLIYSLLWAVCGMSAAPAQAQHAFRVMEYTIGKSKREQSKIKM